jgi:hypothetical protein
MVQESHGFAKIFHSQLLMILKCVCVQAMPEMMKMLP